MDNIITKEIVKNSSDFKLEELELSQNTLRAIYAAGYGPGKRFYDREIVDKGRATYFGMKYGFKFAMDGLDTDSEWRKELAVALDEAGYIRHDFNQMQFRIYQLYKDFLDLDGYIAPVNINEVIGFFGYEDFQVVDEKEIMKIIKNILNYNEFRVVKMSYGLCNRYRQQSYASVGRALKMDEESVKRLEAESLEKLRCSEELPKKIFDNSLNDQEAEKLINELDRLHQDPIFAKEKELELKISKLIKRGKPINHSEEVTKYIRKTIKNPNETIDDIVTSPIYRRRLKDVGVDTIGDLLEIFSKRKKFEKVVDDEVQRARIKSALYRLR